MTAASLTYLSVLIGAGITLAVLRLVAGRDKRK